MAGGESKRVTRAARPEDLADLLERPPRANIAFEGGGRVEATPVEFRYEDGHYLFRSGSEGPSPGSSVALLIDDGHYHSELRGIRVQGVTAAAGDEGWSEIVAGKIVAWDYGAMRERGGAR